MYIPYALPHSLEYYNSAIQLSTIIRLKFKAIKRRFAGKPMNLLNTNEKHYAGNRAAHG